MARSRFSPRERGCSHVHGEPSQFVLVFPARAGMFRSGYEPPTHNQCFPRASGDVPSLFSAGFGEGSFSPRERGCSLAPQRIFQA